MHQLQMSMNKGQIERERSRVVVVIAQRPSNFFYFDYLDERRVFDSEVGITSTCLYITFDLSLTK